MAKCMTAQMKYPIFDQFSSISIIAFLSNFNLACETNGTKRRTNLEIWLFHFFMKKSSSATLNNMLASKCKAQEVMPSVGIKPHYEKLPTDCQMLATHRYHGQKYRRNGG